MQKQVALKRFVSIFLLLSSIFVSMKSMAWPGFVNSQVNPLLLITVLKSSKARLSSTVLSPCRQMVLPSSMNLK